MQYSYYQYDFEGLSPEAQITINEAEITIEDDNFTIKDTNPPTVTRAAFEQGKREAIGYKNIKYEFNCSRVGSVVK